VGPWAKIISQKDDLKFSKNYALFLGMSVSLKKSIHVLHGAS